MRKMKISLILLLSLATVLHPAQAKPIDKYSIIPIWALKFGPVLPPGWGWGSPGWRNRRRQELARRRNIGATTVQKSLPVIVTLKTSTEKEVNGIQEYSYKIKILFSIVGICGLVYLIAIIVYLILEYKQKRKSTDSQTIDV